MLGHTDAGFTLRTYTHTTTKQQEEAADMMGSLMAQSRNGTPKIGGSSDPSGSQGSRRICHSLLVCRHASALRSISCTKSCFPDVYFSRPASSGFAAARDSFRAS